MEDRILDYFGEFEQRYRNSKKIITVKYFYYESQARLYAAKLRDEEIPCFISNANSITAFPLGGGGIGLHVMEDDSSMALHIIKEMDKANQRGHLDDDFYDADEEDIEYLKSLKTTNDLFKPALAFALILISLILVRAFLRANGAVSSWWDFI